MRNVHLAGDNVGLREVGPQDIDALLAIYGDGAVTEHLQFSPRSREAVAGLVERTIANASAGEDRSEYVFMITDESGAAIGTLRLGLQPYRAAEIGFALAPQAWGKGYGTAAVQRALQFAFEDLGLHRVGAARSPANDASAALLHKVGFLDEGVIHDHVEKDGVFRDSVTSYLLEDRWRELNSESADGHVAKPTL